MILPNVTYDTVYNDYLLYVNDKNHKKKRLPILLLTRIKQINN